MEYKVTDIITLLNAEYKGEVIESVSKLSPFFHSDEKSLTFAADGKYDYIFEAEALKVGGEDITDRVIKEMEALK